MEGVKTATLSFKPNHALPSLLFRAHPSLGARHHRQPRRPPNLGPPIRLLPAHLSSSQLTCRLTPCIFTRLQSKTGARLGPAPPSFSRSSRDVRNTAKAGFGAPKAGPGPAINAGQRKGNVQPWLPKTKPYHGSVRRRRTPPGPSLAGCGGPRRRRDAARRAVGGLPGWAEEVPGRLVPGVGGV